MLLALSLLLASCGAPPCPTDRPLEDGDLECTCGAEVLEELPCETTYCTEDDVIIGAGGCT